jgi:GNAT superfamily N-acetyltransferase
MWVAPLRRDVRTLLSRQKNPFFRHAEAEYFLAERGGEVVGRIAAVKNDAHTSFHEDERTVGFFGFFECVDEQAVADALFEASAGWLRSRGLTVMRGPASPSMNDECGLLVDGFDTPPCIMMPHNPRYYEGLVTRAGFGRAMDLLAYQGSGDAPPQRLIEASRKLAERYHITLRPLDMSHFWEEVEQVKRLYNAAWEKNWGFVPMTDEEIHHLAVQLKPVVVPDLVVFAYQDRELIGFAITLPDFNQALRRNPSGRLFPLGLLRILWHRRRITRARTLTLGVLPRYRRTGADALMYEWTWRHGNAHGLNWCEASWLLETNFAIRNGMERLGFAAYKTYRMYDRAL